MFETLKPELLSRVVSIHDFWDLTYQEMSDILEADNLRRKIELKERASMDYVLADLISVGTARLLDDKVKYPSIYEAYSTLFEEEARAQKEELLRKEQEAYKAKWLAFAAHMNSQRGK